MCNKESDVKGFPAAGWVKLDRCMPCFVSEQRELNGYKRQWTLTKPRRRKQPTENDANERREHRERKKKDPANFKCKICGVTPQESDVVAFYSGRQCRPCYNKSRPKVKCVQTEARRESVREAMKRYRQRRKEQQLMNEAVVTDVDESADGSVLTQAV